METWLKESGAVGLDHLELADFPVTGRGVRTLKRFKQLFHLPFSGRLNMHMLIPLSGQSFAQHPYLSKTPWLFIFSLSDRASRDTMACETTWRGYLPATLQASSLQRTSWKFALGPPYIPLQGS